MSWQHKDDEYAKELEKKEKRPGSKKAAGQNIASFWMFLILLGLVLLMFRYCAIFEF